MRNFVAKNMNQRSKKIAHRGDRRKDDARNDELRLALHDLWEDDIYSCTTKVHEYED